MKAKDIMSNEVIYCTAHASVQEVSQLMNESDCGLIPVVDSESNLKPIGVVTDRDIVCRLVAQGKNPLKEAVEACMTRHVSSVSPNATLEECVKMMEHEQIRRLIVVDHNKTLCGMVSQADIALNVPEHKVSELLKKISAPVRRRRAGAAKRNLHIVEAHV
jgi:CBS domain-containing protein